MQAVTDQTGSDESRCTSLSEHRGAGRQTGTDSWRWQARGSLFLTDDSSRLAAIRQEAWHAIISNVQRKVHKQNILVKVRESLKTKTCPHHYYVVAQGHKSRVAQLVRAHGCYIETARFWCPSP